MHIELQRVLPNEIEKRSFEIITQELGERSIPPENEAIVKRVIHTTADFDYYDNLYLSPGAAARGIEALKQGAVIVTDTNMAFSGINKPALAKLGAEAFCFMADPDVAEAAKRNGTTRATQCIDKALTLGRPLVFAIGNAPTALVRICELMDEGTLNPALIIGVPVGFVNVVESKELVLARSAPCIVARGRKGGSNVAAAICNALLYQATGRTL